MRHLTRKLRRRIAKFIWPHDALSNLDFAFMEALLGLDRAKSAIEKYNNKTEEWMNERP